MDWFHALPFLTRWMLVWSFTMTFCVWLGLIGGSTFAFFPDAILKRFHVWRLFTPFLTHGAFRPGYAMSLYMLVTYSKHYETAPYNTGGGGNSADFLVMLLFGMACFLVPMWYFRFWFSMNLLVMYIIYVWSRKAEGQEAGFFMFRFPAIYLPWVLLVIDLITGGSLVPGIIGIVVGHVYYFLVVEAPAYYGYRLIRTPRWVVEHLAWIAGIEPPPVHPSHRPAQTPPPSTAHNWGRGRVLGTGQTSAR